LIGTIHESQHSPIRNLREEMTNFPSAHRETRKDRLAPFLGKGRRFKSGLTPQTATQRSMREMKRMLAEVGGGRHLGSGHDKI